MTTARAFHGFRFPAEVILWAVRWYLQFGISYRDLERMLADRGVAVGCCPNLSRSVLISEGVYPRDACRA